MMLRLYPCIKSDEIPVTIIMHDCSHVALAQEVGEIWVNMTALTPWSGITLGR